MTAVPTEEQGRFRCPACRLGFFELALKKAHIRTAHPKPIKK